MSCKYVDKPCLDCDAPKCFMDSVIDKETLPPIINHNANIFNHVFNRHIDNHVECPKCHKYNTHKNGTRVVYKKPGERIQAYECMDCWYQWRQDDKKNMG